jgi:broad specificity phosphatase PhoE
MTRVIFVRHGQTIENELKVIQGSMPTELTALGRSQALAAANALKNYEPIALYSSHYVRAQQTAAIIGTELGLEVRENTRLREQGLGEWEGKVWADIAADDPTITERRRTEGWWFCPPGGEPRLRVRHRLLAFIDEMRQAHPDSTVAAVTHGGALYFMVHALLDRVPMGQAVLEFRNGGFTIVEASEERVMLVTINEIQHLQRLQEV